MGIIMVLLLPFFSLVRLQPLQEPFACGDDTMSLCVALEKVRISFDFTFHPRDVCLVSGRAILFFERFALRTLTRATFVISRQSRYIM